MTLIKNIGKRENKNEIVAGMRYTQHTILEILEMAHIFDSCLFLNICKSLLKCVCTMQKWREEAEIRCFIFGFTKDIRFN